MPYLTFLFCENCGPPSALDIDQENTLQAYIKEGRESAFINSATLIWDYLVYSCPLCKKKFKYTYRDVEKKVREYFSNKAPKYKEYFDRLEQGESPAQIRPGRSNSEKRIEDRYTYKEK